MKTFLPSAFNWFLRFLHVQLFITLGSLPILICWGLPWSIMSPVGNLLFTPFLMLFLLLSSLLFFFELLHLPNQAIAFFLEKVVEWWTWVLKYHHTSWLISFKKPPFICLGILFVITLLIIHHKKLNYPPKSILGFILLLSLSFSYFKFFENQEKSYCIPCNNGTVVIAHLHNQTVLIDPGVLGQRSSSIAWIEYTLLPQLAKNIGSTNIDHLIIMQPSSLTFEAVTNLCNQTTIKTVHLVTWQGNAQKSFYRNYGIMKKTLKEKNVSLYRLTSKGSTIKFDHHTMIEIVSLEKTLKYHDITFPALQVHASLEHENVIISSAKFKDAC